MKTYSQLLKFYNKNLYSEVKKLELMRQQIIRFQYIVIALMVVIPLLLILLAFLLTDKPDEINFIMMIVVFGIILSFLFKIRIYQDKFRIEQYREAFKQKIICPLIQAMNENFIHTLDHYVSYQLVEDSSLFNARVDACTGNDHVKGTVDEIPFQFSDIKLSQSKTDSEGHVSWTTIFSGTFFVAEFNKHTTGVTVVLSSAWRGNAPGYTRSIKMDNPEFNKQFYVYGTNSIEAHYLLTHTMMSQLLEIKRLVGEDLMISFADGCIYLAIAYGYDPNEGPIYIPVSNGVLQYINSLQCIVGIIRELKLNKKLWGKR